MLSKPSCVEVVLTARQTALSVCCVSTNSWLPSANHHAPNNTPSTTSADAWAKVDADLAYPGVMSVEHVRVWQRPGAISVGCDVPGFTTSEYISCNRQRYVSDADKDLWKFGYCSEFQGVVSSKAGSWAGGWLTIFCWWWWCRRCAHSRCAC